LTREELQRKLEDTAGERAEAIDRAVDLLATSKSIDGLLEATCPADSAALPISS
jgi:hypothetical protein